MSITQKEKDFIHALVDIVGKQIKHPMGGKCVLCVTFDDFDKLPRFFFSKINDVTDTVSRGGSKNENDSNGSKIPKETDDEATDSEPAETTEGEEDEIVNDDEETDGSDDAKTEYSSDVSQSDSGYSSYNSVEKIALEKPKKKTESIPETKNIPKPEPPKFITETLIPSPKFVKYGDDAWLYKTRGDEYIKLSGDKYLSETVDRLDTIAHKMFVKTFGNEYKEHNEYKNMQIRYAKLYGE